MWGTPRQVCSITLKALFFLLHTDSPWATTLWTSSQIQWFLLFCISQECVCVCISMCVQASAQSWGRHTHACESHWLMSAGFCFLQLFLHLILLNQGLSLNLAELGVLWFDWIGWSLSLNDPLAPSPPPAPQCQDYRHTMLSLAFSICSRPLSSGWYASSTEPSSQLWPQLFMEEAVLPPFLLLC